MNAIKHRLIATFAVVFLFGIATAIAYAQTATRYMGSVTAVNGDKLTVKTTQGDEHQVQVPSSAEVKRIEPGQTNLAAAVDMPFSEIASGDRVLVWIDPNANSTTPQALRVVAIKAADLAKKHQQESAEWQIGAGGLVKSVDPSTGTIVITSGAGAAAKNIVIHTDKATILKRYAPTSVNYDSAQPAPFGAIQPGDQLAARGSKNADNSEVAAAEIVSGSFRNISGLIASVDPSTQIFTIKDLATKKQFTVQVPADAQMRQLPANVAQVLAARLKGATTGDTQQAGHAAGTPPQGGGGDRGAYGGQQGAGAAGSGQRGGAWPQHNGAGAVPSNDPQQMVSRAPAIHFADLQKGEAVMLVASPGDSQVTAITLLAGVEPLLEAPASQNLLANWNMGSSGGGEGSDTVQ